MNDHEARKKQLADMQEKSKTKHRSMPQELFFDVFCNPDKYPMGESSNTVGRHLECIDQVMGNFWNIDVKRISPTAKIPTRAHSSDAGWDLYSNVSKTIITGERKVINTGICIKIPKSFVGLIWPRSGMSVKQGIDVLACVVDSGYRGEIKVILFNHGNEDFLINDEDRIAQMILTPVIKMNFEETDNLPETVRGEGGFGSTGK